MPDEQNPNVVLSYRPTLDEMRRLTSTDQRAPQVEAAISVDLARTRRPRIRPPAFFAGRQGYRSDHLAGFVVDLPKPNGPSADDVLAVEGDESGRLDYTHFTVVMSRSRKMARLTAVNIEGARSVSIERENDQWYLDGRIPVAAQLGEELYADNRLDRAHLVRREDPNWGDEAAEADVDTFHFTNCAPQMDIVNQRTWLGLEDYILQNARAWRQRCSVFTGPVFQDGDLPYRDALIPRAYWKVVAFLSDDGIPSATAYVVTQERELGQLEAAFGAYKTYQKSVRHVAGISGIDFSELVRFDGFSNEEIAKGLEIAAPLHALTDIRV